MLKRNACVVLGNIGDDEDLAVLSALVGHEDAIVREHAAWALGRLRTRSGHKGEQVRRQH